MKLTTQTVILCSHRLYISFILPKLTCGNDEYVIYILLKCFFISTACRSCFSDESTSQHICNSL